MDSNHVFLMINGSSGGNKAKALLQLHMRHFRLDDGVSWVWFTDLKDSEQRESTVHQLKSFEDNPRCNVRVVACGGDGTVKWVIELLRKAQILSVPVGVIPFGTGNDMARISGWGGSPPRPLIGRHLSALRKRMKKVLNTAVVDLDVWQVEITVEEDGQFFRVENGVEEVVRENGEPVRTIREEMINYFSVGADAKIVVEFEKNRKATQLRNKVEYGRQIIKQLISPEPKLGEVMETVEGRKSAHMDIMSRIKNKRIVVFQNIPSYAAGRTIWGKKDNRTVTDGAGKQEIGDKLLEAISVKSPQHVILKTSKLAQQNEYHLEFKAGAAKVYFQIDGEGRVAVSPKSITITHAFQVKLLNAKAKPQ